MPTLRPLKKLLKSQGVCQQIKKDEMQAAAIANLKGHLKEREKRTKNIWIVTTDK